MIVSEGKMAPFTHDFRKAQQRMPAIPVNIHHVNFTWQATEQVGWIQSHLHMQNSFHRDVKTNVCMENACHYYLQCVIAYLKTIF